MMPSDLKSISVFFKLYFLPSIAIGIGVFSYCLVYKGFFSTSLIGKFDLHLVTHQDFNKTQSHLAFMPYQKPSQTYQIIAGILNVREKPSKTALIQSKISRFEQVEVLEIKGEWARIDRGWIKKEFLKKI